MPNRNKIPLLCNVPKRNCRAYQHGRGECHWAEGSHEQGKGEVLLEQRGLEVVVDVWVEERHIVVEGVQAGLDDKKMEAMRSTPHQFVAPLLQLVVAQKKNQ